MLMHARPRNPFPCPQCCPLPARSLNRRPCLRPLPPHVIPSAGESRHGPSFRAALRLEERTAASINRTAYAAALAERDALRAQIGAAHTTQMHGPRKLVPASIVKLSTTIHDD
jgi:hypothetical protein